MATPRKTGLGKGLDALFATGIKEEPKIENEEIKSDNIEEKIEGKVLNLKITEVEPNRDQPRKSFNEETLEELAESIKEYGLIQPIIVTKEEGYYAIVAGERRWRACKKAGLKEIAAIVREKDERKKKFQKNKKFITNEGDTTMNKKTNDALRQMYVTNLMEILSGMGEDPVRVSGSEIAIPVVDGDGEDNYVVFKIQVPTGSRDGDPYDPYALAQEYSMKQAEKAAKAEKKDSKKK